MFNPLHGIPVLGIPVGSARPLAVRPHRLSHGPMLAAVDCDPRFTARWFLMWEFSFIPRKWALRPIFELVAEPGLATEL